MLHKESAMAVVIATMLAAASIFGGFSMMPALATHDPDAVEIARQTVSQEDDQSMIVDAVELDAEKSTSRDKGTLTIEIIQEDEVLRSATLGVSDLYTFYSDVEVQVANVEITGSFEVLVEYEGTGIVRVADINVIDTTEPAEEPATGGGSGDGPESPPETPGQELENVIASETMALTSDETFTIETVEFSAEKATSRDRGTVTIAIVQEGEILEAEEISTNDLATWFRDMEVSFDGLEVTDDFEVVFMYDGSGSVKVRNIDVPGTTEPAEEEPTTTPNPDGTVTLLVNAVDESGNEITGMWIEVYSGMSASSEPLFTGDTPETFELEAGPYIVAVADFENNIFQGWTDSTQDRTREATLTSDETFTAIYSTDGTQPAEQPPTEPPTEPPTQPPQSGPGSLTVYAHRIPSEHWGTSTFTGANAEMWFVLYNSTGWLITSNFYDENGTTVSGLNDGETYYIYATNCDECHGSTHDVVFDHWQDSSTENPRAVTTGTDSHAYYAYDPDP